MTDPKKGEKQVKKMKTQKKELIEIRQIDDDNETMFLRAVRDFFSS